MNICCGQNEPTFVVQGGRFNEGGKHNACHSCIGDLIEWIFVHPKLKNKRQEEIMVEVRPIKTTS